MYLYDEPGLSTRKRCTGNGFPHGKERIVQEVRNYSSALSQG